MGHKKIVVLNLATLEEREYMGPTVAGAVIAAYAQREKRDWNTWDYWDKYSKLLCYGRATISIGDWCALKDREEEEENAKQLA